MSVCVVEHNYNFHVNYFVHNIVSTLSLVMLREAPASIRILMTSAYPFSDADIRAVHENYNIMTLCYDMVILYNCKVIRTCFLWSKYFCLSLLGNWEALCTSSFTMSANPLSLAAIKAVRPCCNVINVRNGLSCIT